MAVTSARLAIGDTVQFEFDPEWLALDALPMAGGAGPLLTALGRPVRLRLRPLTGAPLSLELDSTAEFLTGDGLAEALREHGTSARFRLLSMGAEPVLELLPRSRFALAPETPAGEFALDLASASSLLDALEGPRSRNPLSELHPAALALSLAQALDELVGESLLRGLVPFEYQRRVVRRVLSRMQGQAILADEVGLGKTIEAAMVLLEYRARGLARKTLILVPPSLVGQWGEELQRHFNLPAVTQDDREFRDAGEEPWHRFPVLVASLATAKREPNRSRILAGAYDLLIVDEAHHLRNASTQAWKFVNAIQRRFTLLLTATPVQNDLSELFNLVTLLKPGQLETQRVFKKRFVSPDGARNVKELRELLAGVMIRNRRSDSGLDLPPRRAVTVAVPPTEVEAAVYRRLSSLVRARCLDGAASHERLWLRTLQMQAGSSPAALAAALESWGDPQAAALRELLAKVEVPAKTLRFLQCLQELEGEKAVVFTQFRATLAHLASFLERTGFSVRRFQSGMTRLEKDRAVADFEGAAQLLLCTETGSEGRNLQFCHNLVNFDLPWNPMRIEQRLGRLHRIGQTKEVRITNLVTRGTLEHELLEVLERKLDLFQLVVGEMDLILGDVEEETSFEEAVFDAWMSSDSEPAAKAGLEALGARLQEAKKAARFQEELNESIFGDGLVTSPEAPTEAGLE
jgi:SNF2 family DNA or RNA helicase